MVCQSLVRDSLITRFNFVDPDRRVLTRLECTSAIGASCQVSLKSVHQIRRKRFLKGFYHIWAWQPSCSCELDNLYMNLNVTKCTFGHSDITSRKQQKAGK